MNTPTGLRGEEMTVAALRTLYGRYGYTPYKMSKFEEYDLYVRNKDFLISDSIITFTDTNGKLMALKPDVTLSIVKNTGDITDGVRKVYYDEHVYRVAKSSHTFREIRQMGLECLGEPDAYCRAEVLRLAAESLRCIAPETVLDVSHLGIITGLLDRFGVAADSRGAMLKCIGEKNRHELAQLCAAAGVTEDDTAVLCELAGLYGAPSEVLPKLRVLLGDTELAAVVEELEAVLSAVAITENAAAVRLDLSVVGDIRYYNGFVFKGFVSGIPGAVLTGGQYDRLLHKMGKASGAIGFAIYLDLLEELTVPDEPYDADDVLLYEAALPAEVSRAVAALQQDGRRVLALKALPEKLRCRRVWRLTESGVEPVENDA
ncbi:MAG: ATP phosphoribosyltransferase regulatory subunit [Clostridia bacterium]|nr:ATP phosphoribosyltransferase regulatory subunit [Clostridia bacterium]MBQ3141406.1 ATP phosphoribosyltransferase regulatory subunit [Clostridia bacterium]